MGDKGGRYYPAFAEGASPFSFALKLVIMINGSEGRVSWNPTFEVDSEVFD